MEPDISPLAKRLAEENNVDPRTLVGSGTGGRIVERDVLDYLAKVMMGEADVNPTPEPVPEGLEAWPEEDVAGYYAQPQASAPDTAPEPAQDDLLLETDAPAGAWGQAGDAETSPAEVDDISEDLFLFDTFDGGATADEREAYGSAFSPAPTAADEAPPDLADLDFDAAPAAPEAVARGEAGGLELDWGDPGAEAPAWQPGEAAELEPGPNAYAEASAADEDEDDLLFDEPETVASAPERVEEAEDDVPLFVDEPGAEAAEEAEALERGAEPGFEAAAEAPEPFTLERDSLLADETLEDGSAAAPGAGSEAGDEIAADFGAELEAEPEAGQGAEVGDARFVAAAEDELMQAMVGEPEVSPLAAPGAAENLPLVSYGVLLRRHLDLKPLLSAQTALAHELGGEVPLGLLLARAAAKALEQVPLGDEGGLGLARFAGGGIRLVPCDDAGSVPLRELLERGAAEGAAEQYALAVADLSDSGVDEAVLNLGMPVLSLGRILYDSEEGSNHSTLALSGDISVERGTRFLAAAAELLASPVRLIV